MTARASCPVTYAVSRASAGSAEVAPLYRTASMKALLRDCHQRGPWNVVGTGTGMQASSLRLRPREEPGGTILLLGNEHAGLPDGILQECTEVASIAGHPGRRPELLDSLNVSVAAGILLSRLVKNKNK